MCRLDGAPNGLEGGRIPLPGDFEGPYPNLELFMSSWTAAEAERTSGSRRTATMVVLVDDEPAILRAHTRLLERDGYRVLACQTAPEAVSAVARGGVSVVVSDVAMPSMSGLDLLRAVRQHDPDLPVILLTGLMDFTIAQQAIEYGAFSYLTKPVSPDELSSTTERAARLYRLAQAKREALEISGRGQMAADRAGLEANFERALLGLWMAYQPVVRMSDRTVFGYEALLRSNEPSLPGPAEVLDAAERLGELSRLGSVVRERSLGPILERDDQCCLLVNLHPQDLFDENLIDRTSSLAKIADRVVLEITERAALSDINSTRERVAALRELGFRIAVDDLGAGYAGLSSFALLEPEVVKLDMSLVRDIDSNFTKQKLVASMTKLCQEMGMLVIAEGVETWAEFDQLRRLGCDLFQGYLFARPARPFPVPVWPAEGMVQAIR